MKRKDIEGLIKEQAARLSVTHYRISLGIVEDLAENEGAYGTCQASEVNGTALIELDKDLCNGPKYLVKETIIHELLELRLWGIREMLSLYLSQALINEQIHRVIRSVERLL